MSSAKPLDSPQSNIENPMHSVSQRPRIVTRLSWFLLAGLGLAAAVPSCTTEAYCFVCEDDPFKPPDDGGTDGDIQPVGVGGVLGTGGNVSSGGAGNEGGASEGGEGGENSCDGIDFQTDERNCGFCGRVCAESLGHVAFARCEAGQCLIDGCLPGYHDRNGINDDGCEFQCTPTGDEICDGLDNDCNGEIDDDFDLTTPERCGGCNTKCILSHATAMCAEVGTEYRCRIDECEEGFHDADDLDSTGCEYDCDLTNGGVEICDGLDNDCNGEFDEAAPNAGQPCDGPWCAQPGDPDYPNCEGQCAMQGVTVCNGSSLVCVLTQGATLAGIEMCDVAMVDEDCDGVANEGFDLTSDPQNCGGCGNVCNLPHASARCTNSGCEVDDCEYGYADLTNEPGCEYQCPPGWGGQEVCDGIDNDCDGEIDEPAGMLRPANFCVTTGPCASADISCVNGAWRCNYVEIDSRITLDPSGGSKPEQVCDGFDNNCDNRIDEGLGRYQFCQNGSQCSASCNQGRCTCTSDNDCDFGYACEPGAGTRFCAPQCFDGVGACQDEATVECAGNGLGTQCTASENLGNASNELCDGIDNNCDGNVDERNPASGGFLGVRDEMVQMGSIWVYKYEASRPDAMLAQTGTQDARACSKPNVLPWTSVTRAEAAAACAAIPNSAGNPMRLCTQGEWEDACDVGATSKSWSFATSPTVYTSEICNDLEHSRNATTPSVWATGMGANCYANHGGANQIFDLSGNVSEWTSTSFVLNNTTYYRVRGGNYTAYGSATACNFDFVLDVETFANADLGFRCCSGAAP